MWNFEQVWFLCQELFIFPIKKSGRVFHVGQYLGCFQPLANLDAKVRTHGTMWDQEREYGNVRMRETVSACSLTFA
jgi:hypothetical protein